MSPSNRQAGHSVTPPEGVTPPEAAAPSRPELRGGAVGIAVLAFFALAWTGWGMSTGVPTAVGRPVMVTAGLCSLAIVCAAVRLYRRAASAPPGRDAARGRAIDRRFRTIVTAEFLGLFVLARVLVATGLTRLIPLVFCLGVGVHFFPLRRLFHAPVYDRTGAALCLVALATAVLAPLTGQAVLWTMLPGLGAALTLYATCAYLLRASAARVRRR